MTYQLRLREEPSNFSSEFDEYEGGLLESEPDSEPESDEFETAFADLEEEEEARRGPRAAGSTIRGRNPPMQLRLPPPRRRRPLRAIIRPWRVLAGVIDEPSICTCPEQTCPQHGSEYIRWVQSTLNRILGMRLPLNGVLTPATRSGIRSFQEPEKLPVTGIVGPDTERALIAAGRGPSAGAGATKPVEPGVMEPPEPATTPPEPGMTELAEPAAASPAAESRENVMRDQFKIQPEAFEFESGLDEWETGLDEFEDGFGEFEGMPSKPVSGKTCPAYQRGEVEKSRTQAGHLPSDVIQHTRGLLIADFGVACPNVACPYIKESTKKEKLLQDWLRAAKSDLHSIFLYIYGYSDCVGKEKDNGVLRSNRAKQVYALLDKDLQSRVDFIGAARAGEYVADNKTKEGRANNRGVIIELKRLPEQVINIRGTAPQVQPQKPQQRNWKVVGKYSWKGKRRRLAKRGYFEFYAEPEVEGTGSVNATDTEFATFAPKWQKGKGPGGEFETLFNSWFVPDLKIEGAKDGWTVSFKKELKPLGGNIVLKPHLQLSTEVVKTEVVFLPFTIPVTLFGQKVQLAVEPKVAIIIKIDVLQVLKDRLKNRLRDLVTDLLKNLIASLGRGVLGALGGKVLAGLLGGVLAFLFSSGPPTTPVTAPPDDVNGKDRALALVGRTASAAQILQTWANTHRHAFAKTFADTMVELCREKWKDRLAGLRSLSLNGYKALPAASASDPELLRWASTQKALQIVSIDLPMDNFAKRFRWYELMLMFAVAAWILRRITKADVDQATAVALRHASVAGMAAAVQYVNSRIAADTFEFIDEQGKPQKASGIQRWDTIAALVRSSRLSDAEISKRLEELGVKQLPGLSRIA